MTRRALCIFVICLLLPIAGAQSSTLSDLSRDMAAIAKQASPATVQIEVERGSPRISMPDLKGLDSNFRMPKMPDTMTKSVGSGFVIDPSGYILTTSDVVSDAKKITVKFADGSTAEGTLAGSDSITDSALIKVEKTGLKALALGDSDSLQPGMLVVTVNSQAGLDSSVSLGVVASTDREAAPVVGSVMQISGTIGPGASGGAVLDTEGRVVGISFAMFSPTSRLGPWFNVPKIFVTPSREGKKPSDATDEATRALEALKDAQAQLDAYGIQISPDDVAAHFKVAGDMAQNMLDLSRTSGSSGFAIPINKIKPILDELKSGKPIERAMLGIELKQSNGEIVLMPAEGQPAAKAGVKEGDVLVTVNGRKFARVVDVVGYVTGLKPGDKVNLVVRRDGKDVPITVTTTVRAEKPAEPKKTGDIVRPKSSASKTFSLDLENAGIAEVARSLSGASGRSVIVLNPEKITGKVTVHLKSTTLDSALSFICGTLDCKSSKSGEGYVIKPAK